MPRIDLGAGLRMARDVDPSTIPALLATTASQLSATDVVVYLVDFGQTVLEPLPDLATHAEVSAAEDVATTMAGRAFLDFRAVAAERDDAFRVWVPIIEGSDRTGVVALTVADAEEATLQACEELGLLAGYLIATQTRCTDMYNLYRRRRPMTLPASIQWDLLPPLVLKTPAVAVAGHVEPAYEVGGDSFDYAVNGSVLDLAIIDAMGHGLSSALVAALALGSYRHDRREGRPLSAVHDNLARVLTDHYDGAAFATGLLMRIETDTGALTWTNAGHPSPLLIRGGRVVAELESPRTPPWGLVEATPAEGTAPLEPGDSLLLYTDGVTEARGPDGEEFGVERLADLVGQNASDQLQPEEIVRRLARAVVDHQRAHLLDDATVVIAHWKGPDPR
jgi:serine phosphatase RsbU (regulator of sigma subunit)